MKSSMFSPALCRSALAFLLSAATTLAANTDVPPARPLFLLPPPQELHLAGSETLTVGSRTRLSGPEAFVAIVRGVLEERVNLPELKDGAGGITVARPRDPSDALWTHGQAYVLTVRPSGVSIEAADSPGVFYAAQTLAQLIHNLSLIHI